MIQKRFILITGATDGIGKETALYLAKNGYELIIHGKNKLKLEKTKNGIIKATNHKNIEILSGDLSEIDGIDEMVEKLLIIERDNRPIDTIINNAGVFMSSLKLNSKRIEFTFMINYLSIFYFLSRYLKNFVDSTLKRYEKEGLNFYKSRIINVASMAHSSELDFNNLNAEKYFDPYTAYSYSKLEDIMFTFELHDKFEKKGLNKYFTVNTLHPGVISTKLLHSGWGFGGESTLNAAKRLFYMLSDNLESVSGKYFHDMEVRKPASFAYKKDAREKLWHLSNRYLNIDFEF